METSKKKDLLKKFLEKRIEENKDLFSLQELKIIKQNPNLMKKIYILGLNDMDELKKN